MTDPVKPSPSGLPCPRCGAELPPGVPPHLCPKCLLEAGLATGPSEGETATVTDTDPGTAARGPRAPGVVLGHYQLVRLLGQGGMGAVYAAEDLESGRQVALKVLSHKLDSPEARTRFFREGRLAAAVNHPNGVYVFGTEEVAGTPVIAMELVAGGTLQEQVRTRGPLPSTEAVDALLQVVAGLEAAQQAGVLHRDIKPSNCFVATDGTIKVGDFGLSISTTARAEPSLTMTGTVLGTPAFSSPEQLRGEELSVRSDLYSVGATLFFLLTGRAPFEGKNMVQLLANVLEGHPVSPRVLRPTIPAGLAQVVMRCLHRQPGERFKDYAELRQSLAPYSSMAPTPATLGLRGLAGAIDVVLLGLLGLAGQVLVRGDLSLVFSLAAQRTLGGFLSLVVVPGLASLGYYTLLEGRWGAGAGKALCQLRVVGPGGDPPGASKALCRALIFVLLPIFPYWLISWSNPNLIFEFSNSLVSFAVGNSYSVVVASLFCRARRRNGFAALQDWITQTRVIQRTALVTRPVPPHPEAPPQDVATRPTVGPYHVLESLGRSGETEWWLGFDPRLLRKVWLRVVPPGCAPVTPLLRGLARAGRLRWLAGRRSPEANWDAFEAVTGQPLLRLLRTRQPWGQVRFWLTDLIVELQAAMADHTLRAPLTLERVWITGDGRAKLLDFPAPGLATTPTEPAEASPAASLTAPLAEARAFLHEVARATLNGPGPRTAGPQQGAFVVPLPLRVRAWLAKLPAADTLETLAAGLKPLLQAPAAVTRARRAAIVAACLVLPVLAGLGFVVGLQILEHVQARQPERMQLGTLLQLRSIWPFRSKGGARVEDRWLALYLAGHYRQVITNAETWVDPFVLSMIRPENRRFAQQSVADHPAPTPAELREAEQALRPYLAMPPATSLLKQPWFPLAMLVGALAIYVALPALVAALLFRGGLVLRALGVAVVRHDGAPAGRLRLIWRGGLAWSPTFVIFVVALGLLRPLGPLWATVPPLLLLAGLTVWSLLLPERGWPDRLAGTWLVPR